MSLLMRHLVQMITSIALARLLAPGHLSLVARPRVMIGLIDVLRDLGTAASLVQKEVIRSTDGALSYAR